MREISAEMASEYDRIQKRAQEDPGTAGDQGEENWAALLRDWLPRTYEVVTKGRLISHDGRTSPQIDVLVLSSAYPKKLLNKKLYLAAGVLAAFECKTTLKASHIKTAFENCTKVKALYSARSGTPYKELHCPLLYGVLAHSHSWKGPNSKPIQNIEQKLWEWDKSVIQHPRERLDLVTVADLATWATSSMTFFGPAMQSDWAPMAPIYGDHGSASTGYIEHAPTMEGQTSHFTPIGALISYISQRLGWENPAQRELADYYRIANIGGPSKGRLRTWPSSIYSEDIRPRVERGLLGNPITWNEWSMHFW